MLRLLDETLEAFLREEVPLPPKQVDISFSAPDQEWGAKTSRPTVNLFLWDIRQNLAERLAGSQLIEENGHKYRRTPPPRIDCRYLVTAWTSEVGDEHQLLGALLVAFLAHSKIGPPYLRGPLAGIAPAPTMSVASPAETTSSDFWSALGGKLKPGLDLVVTATVDTALMKEVGPAVEQYELRLKKRPREVPAGGGRLVGARLDSGQEGYRVYGPRGSAISEASGQVVLRAEPGDSVSTRGPAGELAQGVVPETGAVDLSTESPAPVPGTEGRMKPRGE